MIIRRMTDRSPTERVSGVIVFLTEMLALVVLGAMLALVFIASGARAGTSGITLHATAHDPLRGTETYTAALNRIQYAGGLPNQWVLHTPTGQVTGTLDQMHYYATGAHAWRADVECRVYVQGRVFAAGFEQ